MIDYGYRTLNQMLQQTAAKFGNREICFYDGNKVPHRITYAALLQAAEQTARGLYAAGVRKGDQILMQLASPNEYAQGFWGTLFAGAVPMALPFAYAEQAGRDVMEKQLNICKKIEQAFILTTENVYEKYEELFAAQPNITVLALERVAAMPNETVTLPAVDPQDTACVLFSSGSTSDPKGVVLSHKTVVASIDGARELIGYTEQDRILSWLPMTHAFGFIGFHLVPVACGAFQCIMPAVMFVQQPYEFLKRISAWKINMFGAMNFALKLLMEQLSDEQIASLDLSGVKNMFMGGEPINADLIERFLAKFAPSGFPDTAPRPIYGLSESAFAISCSDVGKHFRADALSFDALSKEGRAVFSDAADAARFVSVGRPIPGLSVLVLDDDGNALPECTVGEFYYKGDCMTDGYLLSDDDRSKKMKDGYLASGDMGYLSDGEIIITGRKKDIIFINGQNYYPVDIEKMITGLAPEWNERILVCQLYNQQNETELLVFVQTDDAPEVFAEKMKRLDTLIKQNMFLHFNSFIPIDKIPKTASGKIQRRVLTQKYLDGGYDAVLQQIAPLMRQETDLSCVKTEFDRSVLQIWQETLGLDSNTHAANFFDAGGDSIKLIRLAEELQLRFGIAVSLKEIASVLDFASFLALVQHRRDERNGGDAYCAEPDPEHKHDPFDLTDIQFAYLMGRDSAYDMGGIATHGYYEYLIDLDLARFEDALNKVIAYQDNLRLVMTREGKQKILKSVPHYSIRVTDCRGMSDEARGQLIAAKREEMSHAVFDPYRWPLFGFEAFRINETQHILFFGIDLLIMDASSLQMFKTLIMDAYEQPETEFAPLIYTFRDFMQSIADIRKSEKYRADREYWRERAESFPHSPELPMRMDTADLSQPVFRRMQLSLPAEKLELLKQCAGELNISISALICTVYAHTLSHWSNQESCAVNVTIFNKYSFHPDVQRMLGDFTSNMFLAYRFGGCETVADVAGAVQNEMLEGLEHRYFSGVEFGRMLKFRRAMQNKAVMPIVFTSVLNDMNDVYREFGSLLYGISQTSQVYLDCQVYEIRKELVISWDYIEALFDAEMMEAMFEQFRYALIQLADTGKTIPLRALLPETGTLSQFIAAYNDTDAELGTGTLHGLFSVAAARYPDRTAVCDHSGQMTYRQLDEASDRIAFGLIRAGIPIGSNIGVLSRRRKETIAEILGILKAGCVYVPIDCENPQARQELILSESDCKMLLGRDAVPDAEPCSLPETSPSATAYIIFTSGSTGKAKGVVITHESAVNTILDINDRFSVSCEDRIIGLSSLCFDLSVYDIFGALSAGAALYMVSDLHDHDEISRLVSEQGITIWNSVPALMQIYLDKAEQSGMDYWNYSEEQEILLSDDQLRLVLLSGDWIPLSLPDRIKERFAGVSVISLGGATEGSVWSIAYPIQEIHAEWNSIPYGMPLRNQKIYILGYDGSDCPINAAGEICIGGKGVAQGYYGDAEKTAASYFQHERYGRLYRTGDYGKYVQEGYVEFLGRRDAQIKLHGHRIELGEIEHAMEKCSGVKNAAALLLTENTASPMICGYVTGETALDLNILRSELAEWLPQYMIPSVIVQIPEIPYTANQKVDRKALLNVQIHAAQKTYEEPRTETEKKLCAIWSEVLDAERIGLQDNFYDLGGDSLALLKLLTRVEAAFGIRVSYNLLSMPETAAEMAVLIEGLLYSAHEKDEVVFYESRPDEPARLFMLPPLLGIGAAYMRMKDIIPNVPMVCYDYALGKTLEELVKLYADHIVQHPHTDRIILGGHSAGGNLAFEIAKELEKRGVCIAQLLLLDSFFFEDAEHANPKTMKYAFRILMRELIMDGKTNDTMKNVFDDYLDKFLCRTVTGKVHCGITFIRSEPPYFEVNGTVSVPELWASRTDGQFRIIQGSGVHQKMVNVPFVHRNARMIKELLGEI